jgi:hypothetical protein
MGFKMKLSNSIVDFDITLSDEQYRISCYRSGCIGFVFLELLSNYQSFVVTDVWCDTVIGCLL